MVAAICAQETPQPRGHGGAAPSSSVSRLVATAGSLVGVVEGSFEFTWFLLTSIRGGQLWAGQKMEAPPRTPRQPTAAAKALLELTSTRLLDLSKIPSKGVLDLQQLLRDLTGGIPLDSFELDDLSSDDDMVDDDYDD